MRTDYSKIYKQQIIPVVAMLVAYVWSSLVATPVTSHAPYPLPSETVAASTAEVQTN